MVKLYFIGVFEKQDGDVTLVKSATDLTSFDSFQRNVGDDYLRITAQTVVSRMEVLTRTSIKKEEYVCHAFVRLDKTAVAIVSDEDYPSDVAHSITLKILEELPNCNLEDYLKRYQNPNESNNPVVCSNILADAARRAQPKTLKLDDRKKFKDASCQTHLDLINVEKLLLNHIAYMKLLKEQEQQIQQQQYSQQQQPQYSQQQMTTSEQSQQAGFGPAIITTNVQNKQPMQLDEKQLLEQFYQIDGILTTTRNKVRAYFDSV